MFVYQRATIMDQVSVTKLFGTRCASKLKLCGPVGRVDQLRRSIGSHGGLAIRHDQHAPAVTALGRSEVKLSQPLKVL